jgi:hypothetical protein
VLEMVLDSAISRGIHVSIVTRQSSSMKLDRSRLSIGLACHLQSAELVFQPEGSRSSGLSADAAVLAAFLRYPQRPQCRRISRPSRVAQDFDFTEILGILTEIMY